MQLKIYIKLDAPLIMPIGYHHILQSVYYKLMSGDIGTNPLHDKGVAYNNRDYKLFTFGPIEGKFVISNGRIVFTNNVSIEFRAYNAEIADSIYSNIRKNGITFGEHTYKDIEMELSDKYIDVNKVIVRQISPICVYETDSKTKHTRYYNPGMKEFYDGIQDNFCRKYYASQGEMGEIFINKIDVCPNDKYITKYKGFIIEAYKGTYILSGKEKYLDFLYQTGLGAKNSQGFGMFEIV